MNERVKHVKPGFAVNTGVTVSNVGDSEVEITEDWAQKTLDVAD